MAAAPAQTSRTTKGRDPRKHHYVPVFYQTHFVNTAGLLWVYDRRLRTFKELHPLAICFEKDLYALKPEGKPRDTRIESKVLASVDALGSEGIRSFSAGKGSADAETEVAFFMAFQYTRVPTVNRDIRATYVKLIEEMDRIMFSSVERARAVMESYTLDMGESMNVTPEEMVEATHGKHFHIVATEVPFLRHMMEQAVGLSKLLSTLDWEILVASHETGFILCDCPVVIVPPRGSSQVGFIVPGSAKYFPLTRSLCLRLGEPGRSRRFRKIDREAVRIINQNIAANSERFIMGPSRVQLENVIERSEEAYPADGTPIRRGGRPTASNPLGNLCRGRA